MQTAVQLYSLRDLDEPLTDTIARVGETAFDGVELAGLGDETPEAVAAALAEAGLDVAAAHVGLESLEDDLEGTLDAYGTVGVDHLVVPWVPPEDLATCEAVEAVATRLVAVGERVRERGFTLSYHNHDQEFREGDGDPPFAVLARGAPALTFEVDAGWVLAGGYDPAAFVREYADRLVFVHVKDVAVGANREPGDSGGFVTDAHRPVELGDGDLDVDAVVAAARDVGVEWCVYEHDAPADPLASLAHGAEELAAAR